MQKHCADEHSVAGSGIRTDPSNFSQDDSFVLERERKSVLEHLQSFRRKINDGSIFDPFEFLVLQEQKIGICIEVKFTKPLTDDNTLCFFHSPIESLSTSLTAEEYFSHIDKLLT